MAFISNSSVENHPSGTCVAILCLTKSNTVRHSFLFMLSEQCPYEIDDIYSDKGKAYKGNPSHAFAQACCRHNIGQKFTQVARPQTNGKAKRVIRTIMQMRHEKMPFTDSFLQHSETA